MLKWFNISIFILVILFCFAFAQEEESTFEELDKSYISQKEQSKEKKQAASTKDLEKLAKKIWQDLLDYKKKLKELDQELESKIEDGFTPKDIEVFDEALEKINKKVFAAREKLAKGQISESQNLATEIRSEIKAFKNDLKRTKPAKEFKKRGKLIRKLRVWHKDLAKAEILIEYEKEVHKEKYEKYKKESDELKIIIQEYLKSLLDLNLEETKINPAALKEELKPIEKRVGKVIREYYGETYFLGDDRKEVLENRGKPFLVGKDGKIVSDKKTGEPMINKRFAWPKISFHIEMATEKLVRSPCFRVEQEKEFQINSFKIKVWSGTYRKDLQAEEWTYVSSPTKYIFAQISESFLYHPYLIHPQKNTREIDPERDEFLHDLCREGMGDLSYVLIYVGDRPYDAEMVLEAMLGGIFRAVDIFGLGALAERAKALGVKPDFSVGNYWFDREIWKELEESRLIEEKFNSFFEKFKASSEYSKKDLNKLAEALNNNDNKNIKKYLLKSPSIFLKEAEELVGLLEKRDRALKIKQKAFDEIVGLLKRDEKLDLTELAFHQFASMILFLRLEGVTLQDASVNIEAEAKIWKLKYDHCGSLREEIEVKITEKSPNRIKLNSLIIDSKDYQTFAVGAFSIPTRLVLGRYKMVITLYDNLAGSKTDFEFYYDIIPPLNIKELE